MTFRICCKRPGDDEFRPLGSTKDGGFSLIASNQYLYRFDDESTAYAAVEWFSKLYQKYEFEVSEE